LWGWQDKAKNIKKEVEVEEPAADHEGKEAIVDELKGTFDNLEWIGGQRKRLQVRVAGKALNFGFDIRERQTKLGTVYDAECMGDSAEAMAITRYLAKRKAPGNLRYLLVCIIMSDEWIKLLNCTNRKCFQLTRISEQRHVSNVANM
jgi:hypothetical protein